ncbi:MAG: excinuclease ABC subunit UvrC [Syntrophomonas sp.]|nr:excinuclease ABC subunit UvrC [Syntrophomonas sp.]
MKQRLKNVPQQPGVYLYRDKEGRVIYIGKARVLRSRMRSYFQSPAGMHPKVRAMMARVGDFDYIVTATEVEALILESNLIKAYQPRYNIDLRDDKSYPYLKITAEEFPRLCIVREKKDKVSRYYGPYAEVGRLRETIKVITTIFPLRTCKSLRNNRPCLNRDLGKCIAPCTGLVAVEEYQSLVEGIVSYLEGNGQQLAEQIAMEMKAAAANLEFEKAARLRDQASALKVLGERQQVSLDKAYDLDMVGMIGGEQHKLLLVFKLRAGKIIAKETFWLRRVVDEADDEVVEFFLKQYYADNPDVPPEILVNLLPPDPELIQDWLKEVHHRRCRLWKPERGEKRALVEMVMENARLLWEERMLDDSKNRRILEELARTLELEVIPQRIECFDVSHLGGEETVASMTVATMGRPDKKAYRRFKIRTEQNNDVASLSEALRRRFQEARHNNPAFLPEPDLLLIDGGLGQVNAARLVLDELGLEIPVLGLAKREESIFWPGRREPLRLPRRDEGLQMLQRLRDEAHRFAVQYNRQRRGSKVTRSALDEIEGVGPKRKQSLLLHFGSVARLKTASREELAQVPGLNHPTAERIYNHFHQN